MRKIAGLIVIILFAVVLTACGPKGETPEQAVTNALNAIRDYDKIAMEKYLDDDFMRENETEDDEENTKLLCKKLVYTIKSSSVNGDTATVKAEVTNLDMGKIMAAYMEQALQVAFANAFAEEPMGDEELEARIEEIFLDLLGKEDNDTVTTTVDIKLTKGKSNWIIDSDEAFQDAVLGGLLTALQGFDE